MQDINNTSTQPEFSDVLKSIHFTSKDELSKKTTGLKIAKRIYSIESGSSSINFFKGRAAHWETLEKWSLGKQDMTQFLEFMNIVDANKSYAKIDTTPIMLGAQFVGTKIESLAKTEEYPCTDAIDDDSIDEKEKRQLEALFRMRDVGNISEIQNQSGVQLEPSNVYVPDDELSAKVYFELEDRLPKEIEFNKLSEKALIDNNYTRVLKPRLLRDNIVFGLECTKVEKVYGKKYSIRRCVPKNLFYNVFLSDNGKDEISYIGEAYNLKVKDIRSKFGKSQSNKEGLTEQEIYDFAKKSAQNYPANPQNFNHQFGQENSIFGGATPWDDYSGFVIDFEIEVVDSDFYVTKIDSYGKENITPKKGVPKGASEKSIIQRKEKKRWYRCVYAPYADMVIYWGKPDLTILDYTDTGKSFCSYSINIPNNTGEYSPSLFERALEPLKRYALIILKIKLLIGKLSPAAYRIDVESARNITDGDGNAMDWEQVIRIKDTTGVELWSSKGLDPLSPASPVFSAATSDPTIGIIVQLSEIKNSVEQEIRGLLGVPIYLDGSDVGQRTAAKLAEGQSQGSFNVTGFVPNGHNQLMEETLNKICILSWQDIVTDKKESSNDLINTRFKITVKMKSTEYEKQQLERDIQQYSQIPDKNGNPSISLKDAMVIRDISDPKLAQWYLSAKYEENRRKAIADSERLQEQNAKVQNDSLQQKAANDKELQAEQLAAQKEAKEFESTKAKELALLNGLMAAIGKGIIPPDTIMPAIQQLVPNIVIPLQVQHKQLQDGIVSMAQQEQEQQMQQEAQEQQEGEQGNTDMLQESQQENQQQVMQ
jgi:hypothetical protein